MNNNDNYNFEFIKIIVENLNVYSNGYKQITNSLPTATQNAIISMNEISKSVQPMIQSISEISKAVQPMIQSLNEVSKTVAPIIQQISESTAPLIEYLNENQDKIFKFSESFEQLIEQFDENTSTDEAFDIIENLFDDNKAFINEDWEIEIIDDQKEISKPKSRQTISDLIALVGIAVQLVTSTPNIEVNIDSSVTNNEYHYHINHMEHVNTEHVVVKQDTIIHVEANEKSNVMSTLQIGDIVYTIVTEDTWTLIVVLNENNQIKQDGWVKSEYINPIIE